MAMQPGGHLVAKTLKAEGVSHVFTLCGGHIQAIYDGCLDEGIRVVDVRHEQSAGHAADGWARVTGEPGVALVTAGPGVTDVVTGVANAYRAGVPMIVLGGQGPLHYKGMGSLQEMDHVGLMASITKWSDTIPETRRIPDYLAKAYRIATTGVPGPVFLEVPIDVLMGDADAPIPTGYRTTSRPAGDPATIERVAALLRDCERPMAIVGSQLWWSSRKDAFQQFLARAPMPTYLNGMGRGALPPGHPCLFTQSRKFSLAAADVILIFGTPIDFRLSYGADHVFAPDAKLVQIDLDGSIIGQNRHVAEGIVGDTGLVFAALADALPAKGKDRSAWLASVRAEEDRKLARILASRDSSSVPIDPIRMCAELAKFVDEDAIVIGDGGDIVGTGAYVIQVHKQGHWLDPGPLGTLGVGPAFAMAAKLAKPRSRVFVLYGDGSFGLNGMEFEAAARQGIPFVGVIGNDAAWMQIRRGQVQLYGEERSVATALDYTRYDKMVEALGGYGEWVVEPGQIAPAIQRALDSGRPALVNVKIGQSDFRAGALSV